MSLIQERMAIDRARLMGIVTTVVGGVLTVLWLIPLVTEPFQPLSLLIALGWLVGLGSGVHQILKAKRRRIAFEAAHGPSAGKQQPSAGKQQPSA